MFRKTRLGFKLTAGFAIAALITLGVGFSGWFSVNRLSERVNDVSRVRLPGVASLLGVEKSMESIRVALRTLLNPDLKAEDRARQFGNIEAARTEYQAAWEVYAALPKAVEEIRLSDEFRPAVAAWAKENNEFLRLAKELEATGITNPRGTFAGA